MTTDVSPSGTDGHPEVADISALTEGLLPPDEAVRLRGHLEGCTLCADVRASLEEIRGALGTLPGPVRMPEDVAERIDAALAAEALLDSTAPPAAESAVSRETTSASAPCRPAVSRETTDRRPPGRPAAATGPGRRARGRRRTALLTGACAVVALGLGGVVYQQAVTGDVSHRGTGPAATAQGGQDARLEQHVHDLLQAATSSPHTAGRGSSDPAPDSGRAPGITTPLEGGGPSSVPTCVRKAIHRSQTPLAVDERTSYRGQPAYLVVLPHTGDPQRVDVYLVDSACTTGAEPEPGEVLLQRTYARS